MFLHLDFFFQHLSRDQAEIWRQQVQRVQVPRPDPSLGLDHVISTGRQMTNLVSNFEYLVLLSFLTEIEF